MPSPPESITVHCPKCGIDYQDWWRPSINLALDDFDDDYIEAATTSTCPSCGYKVAHHVLLVGKDRVWRIREGSESDDDEESL